MLNCYVAPPNRLGYVVADMRPRQTGATIVLRGSRLNVTTRQIKQFAVSDNVYMLAGDLYSDFNLGDRGQDEVNPKYAHLGWNQAWENQEWWADSTKPHLSL